jgi:replicative DNA helicase
MGKQGRTTHRASDEPQGLRKIATGVAGLDDILEGGFPAGRTTLISGGPGTGRTMLGLEFLYRSALAGKLFILEACLPRDTVLTGDITITPLLTIIEGKAKAMGADRFVITDNGIEITAMAKEARLSELHSQASTARSHAETEGNTGGEES